MNVTINSQVQSPFVRTLEAVPTLSGSFTHHIPDNTPPVSMTRIVQAAVDTSSIEAAGEKVFNIPQYGYLHKVVARVRGTMTAVVPTALAANAQVFPHFFDDGAYGLIDEVSLNTRNRPIERMYGRQMYADAVSGDAGQTARKLDMASFHITSYDATPAGTGPVANKRRRLGQRLGFQEQLLEYGTAGLDAEIASGPTVSASLLSAVIDSYVEIPFSSTQTLASNFNTRFVEPITVNLKTLATSLMYNTDNSLKSGPATDGAPQGVFTVELLCYFLNYHDLTESDIRDNNFKPDAPAVVFGSDVRQEPTTPIPVKLAVTSATNESTYTVDVRSNNICKELLVLASPQSGATQEVDYGFNNLSLRNRFQFLKNLRFTGSGQELYNSSGYEALMVDRFDHALSTWSNLRSDGFSVGGSNGQAGTTGGEVYTSALPVYKIQFGLSSDPTYNSGCIGLQTVSNPQVEVVVQGETAASDLFVYVKHHALVQIDSGTGAISRSIDA